MKFSMNQSLATSFLAVSVFATGTLKTPADSILVLNPSFEDNTNADAGYGSINNWAGTGGSGPNNGGQPFASGTNIPDRAQVAFQQGIGTLSQTLAGLDTTKQYWFQVFYGERQQTNVDDVRPVLEAKYGAQILVTGATFATFNDPSYKFVNAAFTPSTASASLTLSNLSAVTGGNNDNSLLLDAISVIQRDADQVVIKNPSFEASGTTVDPGYSSLIAGWSGGSGVNNNGQAFAGGTTTPDGVDVAFQQGTGSLSQTIDNLSIGSPYELKFYYNARLGTENLTLNATIGALTALNTLVTPSPGAYTLATYQFAATAASMPLSFASSIGTGPGNDYTLLIDNVSIRLIPEPSSLVLLAFGGAIMGLRRRRRDK